MRHIFYSSILFFLISCDYKSKREDILADIISYNKVVFNKTVTNCKIIDNNASCADKTESYLISCEGSSIKFKWDKMYNSISGEDEINIYSIPQNTNSYHCNPELNYKKKYHGHQKLVNQWVPKNYSE